MATLEELFPINLAERPLRFNSEETNPITILRSELARVAKGQQEHCDYLLSQMAMAAFQLSRLAHDFGGDPEFLREGMDLIQANLRESLARYHVQTIDLTGMDADAVDRAVVDIRGQKSNPEVDKPTVSHTELPIVTRGARCLVRGAISLDVPSTRQ